MNSMISCSRLLTAALCGAVLAGCNAVEDVPDEPSAALPAQTVVLGGHIKDLGVRRPLVLQYNSTDTCLVPAVANDPTGKRVISECKFLGVADQEFSGFSFGALTVGTPYNITVKRQPFGKVCTVQNPSGTVSTDGAEIRVTCVDDATTVPHYNVTVNVAAAALSKPGLKVILTTENGTCPVDVNGRSSITFSPTECPDSTITGYHRNATYLFNNQLNLPNFTWRVTASIPGATVVAPRTNCFVNGGPVLNTGGNIADDGNADAGNRPTGNTTVTVQSCGFTVRVQADYSRPAGVTTDPVFSGSEGITLALRSQPSGVDVAAAKITSFANAFTLFMVPDANGNPTTTVFDAQSDTNAFYELVVKSSPTNMACIPGASVNTGSALNSATRQLGNHTDGGAVLLRQPASAYVANLWLVDRVIRCRAIATSPGTLLRGVYWQYTTTTTTRTIGGGVPAITAPTVRNRNLLTFFEDGQYLFGNHGATATSNGVEQGFYEYNPTAATLVFTGFTDTNGSSGIHTSSSTGAPVPRTITAVVKYPGTSKRIAARVSNTTANGITLAASGGNLTVAINNGQAFDANPSSTTAVTYTTANFAALITAINAANPGGAGMAVASGSEIRITGPAGGVVFSGSAVATLGLPPSVAAGAVVTSTNVGTTLATSVNTIVDWMLAEVGPDTQVPSVNPIDGAWVTWDWQRQPAPVEDRRRIFVYQHGLYTGFHVGVNGIPNLQEACFVGDFGLTGTWTRQGGRSGCNMRVYTTNNDGTADTFSLLSSGSSDIPNATTALKDYPGRWPQSQNPEFTDGRPYSLVEYELRLAGTVPSDPVCPTVDKLTVWDTQNGVRKDTLSPAIPRIVLCRITAN